MPERKKDFSQLASAAFTFPIIDNHAHNILRDEKRSHFSLKGIVSEATGEALDDAVHSVAHYRAISQLARLFNCEPSFEAVTKARDNLSYETLCELCFKPTGIASLLLDDGLDKIGELCYDIKWHNRLTSSESKHIVRIEVFAQNLIGQLLDLGLTALNQFWHEFSVLLIKACKDPHVVGFKSVACYRTGLNIEKYDVTDVQKQYAYALSQFRAAGKLRLAHKALNDAIVRLVLKVAGQHNKPVQFHTGLGDNDIRLVSSNPSLMQPVIEEFPDTKFVLLHASYPFTQEAGYLASVYKNVYLDFGEVFPMVSPDGQRTLVKQVFELTPTSKLLWSTDGHWWPESFYLAALQVREVLYDVLADSVAREEMTEGQAVDVVERVLFHNSNALYNLNLPHQPSNLKVPQLLRDSAAPVFPTTLDSLAANGVRQVRIHWVDYCGLVRYRVLPIAQLQRMVARSSRPGVNVTKAAFGMVRLMIPPSLGPLGEYLLKPDLTSLRIGKYAEGHAYVAGSFEEKEPVTLSDGSTSVNVPMDPRTVLRHIVKSAQELDNVNFLVGFEIEFILLVPEGRFPSPVDNTEYAVAAALRSGSAAAKTLDGIADALEAAGIELQQYHAEGADGQFEVVTGPLPPVQAVDALIATREIIFNVASMNGLRATFTPRLFEHTCGSALHTHISVSSSSTRALKQSNNAPMSEVEASFLQSLLDHLPAVNAFTLPSPASYARVLDGIWSGGTWVAWGRDNRETPVRLCGTASEGWNFEVKCHDFTVNPYLSVAAMLSAGLLGVRKSVPLRMRDCQSIAASLSDDERDALGITTRLSSNLDQAIENLRKDKEIVSMMGEELVGTYISTIEIRRDILAKLNSEGQRKWMADFY